MSEGFVRVSRAHPCPICGKPDWCTVSADGRVAFCMRLPSGRQAANGAYIHTLREDVPPMPVRHARAGVAALPARAGVALPRRPSSPPMPALRADVGRVAKQDRSDALDYIMLDPALGEVFGFDVWDAAERMGVYWSRSQRTMATPMRDAHGRVRGIRYRDVRTGRKWSQTGGGDGLFLPLPLTTDKGEVWVAEGMTDTIALNALGIPAIGRSSCNCGTQLLAEAVRLAGVKRLTVVADNDGNRVAMQHITQPGADGALAMAKQLGVPFRLVFPPRRTKDVRGFVLAMLGYGLEMVARLVRQWARDAKWQETVRPMPRRTLVQPPLGTFGGNFA